MKRKPTIWKEASGLNLTTKKYVKRPVTGKRSRNMTHSSATYYHKYSGVFDIYWVRWNFPWCLTKWYMKEKVELKLHLLIK
jgi:hypothetical protein